MKQTQLSVNISYMLVVGYYFISAFFLSLFFFLACLKYFKIFCLFIWESSIREEMFLPEMNMTLGQAPIQGNMNFVQVKTSGNAKWQVAVWKDKDKSQATL